MNDVLVYSSANNETPFVALDVGVVYNDVPLPGATTYVFTLPKGEADAKAE